MASNLIALRTRIKSVRNTQKLTKAMKTVSAAKLRKVSTELKKNSNFLNELFKIFAQLVRFNPQLVQQEPLFKAGSSNRRLLLLISSDRGLCGAFNTNIFRFLETEIKQSAESNQELDFILMGTKALRYFQRRKIPFKKDFSAVLSDFSFQNCLPLVDYISEEFLCNNYQKVEVISYDFVSSSRQQIRLQNILPLEVTPEKTGEQPVEIIFEPEARSIFRQIVPLLVQNRIYRIILNSLASEHSARMIAMDLATRNAAKMIETLTLVLNKTRQALITKELLEIMTATEALRK